jgi:hypothetical protein
LFWSSLNHLFAYTIEFLEVLECICFSFIVLWLVLLKKKKRKRKLYLSIGSMLELEEKQIHNLILTMIMLGTCWLSCMLLVVIVRQVFEKKNCVIWFLSFVEEISYWFGEWIHMLLWLCSVTLAIVHHMCKWVNWFVFVFSLFNFLFDRFPMLIILFDWFSSYLVFCSFDWLFLSFYLFSYLVSLPSINSSFNCSSL